MEPVICKVAQIIYTADMRDGGTYSYGSGSRASGTGLTSVTGDTVSHQSDSSTATARLAKESEGGDQDSGKGTGQAGASAEQEQVHPESNQ